MFNAMELDAIGEVMNISLGSSATAVSNLLDHRVDITTPSVSVVPVEEFSIGDLEPAIAIEIKYVSGLEGSNIMLLKREDVKVIVDILMGGETPDEEFEIHQRRLRGHEPDDGRSVHGVVRFPGALGEYLHPPVLYPG